MASSSRYTPHPGEVDPVNYTTKLLQSLINRDVFARTNREGLFCRKLVRGRGGGGD